MLAGSELAAALDVDGTPNDGAAAATPYDRRVCVADLAAHVSMLVNTLANDSTPLRVAHVAAIRAHPACCARALAASILPLARLAPHAHDPLVARLLVDILLVATDALATASSAVETDPRRAAARQQLRASRAVDPSPPSPSAVVAAAHGLVRMASLFHGIRVPRPLLHHGNVQCSALPNVPRVGPLSSKSNSSFNVLPTLDDDHFVEISLIPDVFNIIRSFIETAATTSVGALDLHEFKLEPVAVLKVTLLDWAAETITDTVTADPLLQSLLVQREDDSKEHSIEPGVSAAQSSSPYVVADEDTINRTSLVMLNKDGNPSLEMPPDAEELLASLTAEELDLFISTKCAYIVVATLVNRCCSKQGLKSRTSILVDEAIPFANVAALKAGYEPVATGNLVMTHTIQHLLTRTISSFSPASLFQRTEVPYQSHKTTTTDNAVTENDTSVADGNVLRMIQKMDTFVPGLQMNAMISDEEITGDTKAESNTILDTLSTVYSNDVSRLRGELPNRVVVTKEVEINSEKEALSYFGEIEMTMQLDGSTACPHNKTNRTLNVKPSTTGLVSPCRSPAVSAIIIECLTQFIAGLLEGSSPLLDRLASALVELADFIAEPDYITTSSAVDIGYYRLSKLFMNYPALYDLIELTFVSNQPYSLAIRGEITRTRSSSEAASAGVRLIPSTPPENPTKPPIEISSVHYVCPAESSGIIPEHIFHGEIFHRLLAPLLDVHKEYWSRERKIDTFIWRAASNRLLCCLCKGLDAIGSRIPVLLVGGAAVDADYFRVLSIIANFFRRKEAECSKTSEGLVAKLAKSKAKHFVSEHFWRPAWMPMIHGVAPDLAAFIMSTMEV